MCHRELFASWNPVLCIWKQRLLSNEKIGLKLYLFNNLFKNSNQIRFTKSHSKRNMSTGGRGARVKKWQKRDKYFLNDHIWKKSENILSVQQMEVCVPLYSDWETITLLDQSFVHVGNDSQINFYKIWVQP
jgi:hypothetical protein